MKGDKLGKHGGSGSQKLNHERRQAWETSRQRQPRAKLYEVMKGDKLEKQDGSGSQERYHEGRQA